MARDIVQNTQLNCEFKISEQIHQNFANQVEFQKAQKADNTWGGGLPKKWTDLSRPYETDEPNPGNPIITETQKSMKQGLIS